MNAKQTAEFQNEVQRQHQAGISYPSAFARACRARPDLVKKMRRSPIVARSKSQGGGTRASFVNAPGKS